MITSATRPPPLRRGNPVPLVEPITHRSFDGTRESFSLCQCVRCAIVARCTPVFDFFTVGEAPDEGKPLLCPRCFYYLAAGGIS